MKRYILGVEFYKPENEEEPAMVQGELMNLVDGSKLAIFDIPDEVEDEKEFLLKIVNEFIKMLKNTPSEIIKTQLPKFYKASTTKQFWLHIFPETFVAQNQIKEEPVFEDPSLEANLDTELGNTPLLDNLDIFIDFEGNEMNGPPDRINFWDSL
jgi:hypothetical protein